MSKPVFSCWIRGQTGGVSTLCTCPVEALGVWTPLLISGRMEFSYSQMFDAELLLSGKMNRVVAILVLWYVEFRTHWTESESLHDSSNSWYHDTAPFVPHVQYFFLSIFPFIISDKPSGRYKLYCVNWMNYLSYLSTATCGVQRIEVQS